jgi:4-amino-4-deoxy-L-arabinose transferase-like glycosyltransferase
MPAASGRALRDRIGGFGAGLVLIVIAGVVVRLLYGLIAMRHHVYGGDSVEYKALAQVIADAGKYVYPIPYISSGTAIPTADKPPLYPLYLAFWIKIGVVHGFRSVAVVDTLLGASLIVGIGLLGRRVGNARTGLIAAAIAAFYPLLFMLDGAARSEVLEAPLIAFALLAAYRLLDKPTVWRGIVLGLLIGLAALTRSEAVALVLLLGIPAVLLAAKGHDLVGAVPRLKLFGAVIAGSAVLLVPWLVRNWIAFDRPTSLSTNQGTVIYGANCHDAYYRKGFVGTWSCFKVPPRSFGTNEAVVSSKLQHIGVQYAKDHAGRVPYVVAVRLARTWGLYYQREQARLDAFSEDRIYRWEVLGLFCYLGLAVLAIVGCVVVKRRGDPLSLLAAPAIMVTLVTATGYGSTRFRVAAEIPIVVLSAVAVEWAAERVLARRRRLPAGTISGPRSSEAG